MDRYRKIRSQRHLSDPSFKKLHVSDHSQRKFLDLNLAFQQTKVYPRRCNVEAGRLRHWAYPGIRHTGDLEAPRQWFLPSSLIVSTTSGILKDYPLLYSHREGTKKEREKERKKINNKILLFSGSRPRNNWKGHETPAREIDARTRQGMENLAAYLRPTKPPLAFLLGSSCYGYTRYVLNSRHYAFQWPTNYARGARVVPENRGVEGKAKERKREERAYVWKAKVRWMGGRLLRSWRATIHRLEDGAGIPRELNRA